MEATRLFTTIKFQFAAALILVLFLPTAAFAQAEDAKTELEQEFDKADNYLVKGRPDLVITALQPLADKYPKNSIIPLYLTDSYTSLGMFEQGEKWLRIAMKHRDDIDYSMLANFYTVTGNKEALLEILKEYQFDEDQTADFYKSLGIAAAAAGQYELATHYFSQSAALSDEPFLNLHYALALRELGQTEEANAIIEAREQVIRAQLTEKPNDAFAHYVMGEIHGLKGDAEQAAMSLRLAFGKKIPYYLYWTLSDGPGSDGLWDKVRDHPEFQAYVEEKRQQMLASRAKLEN